MLFLIICCSLNIFLLYCRRRLDVPGLGFGGFDKREGGRECEISSKSVMDGLYFASQG